MSLQDLLLGNQYLAHQAALAAAAVASIRSNSNSNNNNNNTTSNNNININNNNNNGNYNFSTNQNNSSNNNNAHQLNNQLLLNAIKTAEQLQLHQHQQATGAHEQQLSSMNSNQQQILPLNMKLSNTQVQWNQYQQALASALMSLGAGCDLNTGTFAPNAPTPRPPPTLSVVQSKQPANSTAYWRLLESLFDMNDEPEDEAIELIAKKINSSTADVANWFQTRREAEKTLCNNTAFPNAPTIVNENLKTVPSSTLLAKLNSVTSRPNSHILATHLDQKMIDLLEAFYAINDNPEPAAIEMIAKRINTTVEAIGDWFDEKRIKTNPHAGPRSPPAKKREGGRVVTFSEYQRSLLEAIFDENNYLHPQEYEELSNLIQVPSRNIKIWFKNRRSKQRLSGRTTRPGSVNNSD